MAPFFTSKNCIKRGMYVLDEEAYSKTEIPYHLPNVPVLKKYLFNLSYEEKYRFGILTVYEYYEWMKELAEEAQKEAGEAEKSPEGHTFWASDEGERKNLDADAYQDFLVNNSVSVSNSTAFDFDALAKEFSGSDSTPPAEDSAPSTEEASSPTPAVSDEVNMDEILANVNKDIHGGDAILTQEEIEALFAAASAGN